MALDVSGREKPVYAEGQEVRVTIGNTYIIRGKIRGRSFEHAIDFWIVEISEEDRHLITDRPDTTYPWSCIVVPHPQISAIT
jgi:hypothetical protein